MPDTLRDAAERLIASMPDGTSATGIRRRARLRRRRRSVTWLSAVVILSLGGLTAVRLTRPGSHQVRPADTAPASTSVAPSTSDAPSTTDAAPPSTAPATAAPTSTIVNRPPIATNDELTVVGDAALVIPVIANDADADGDRLHLVGVSNVVGGTATIEGESVRITPDADFVGTLTFVYVVADEADASSAATVTITVTG